MMQTQLKAHKSFNCAAHFAEYVHGRHGGDYEAAYEEFATSEDAPHCCRDDFKEIEFEDDGEEINDANATAGLHRDFQVYQVNPVFDKVASSIDVSGTDWRARSAERYTPQQLKDAGRWLEHAAKGAKRPMPMPIDVTQLNEGQAFVFRVVSALHAAHESPVAPREHKSPSILIANRRPAAGERPSRALEGSADRAAQNDGCGHRRFWQDLLNPRPEAGARPVLPCPRSNWRGGRQHWWKHLPVKDTSATHGH
jgi:hypothetical protein